jgi:hypothetical protein
MIAVDPAAGSATENGTARILAPNVIWFGERPHCQQVSGT